MKEWIGKYVQVYPGDTWSKFGTVADVSSAGVTFIVDGKRSKDADWKEDGIRYFIAFSSNLSFKEAKKV